MSIAYITTTGSNGQPQINIDIDSFQADIEFINATDVNTITLETTLLNGKTIPVGNLVGTTDTQTITGKTMDYNLNTFLNFADATGITDLNGLNNTTQTFATGTTGTNFNISSTGSTHTFNIPDASGTNRGLVTNGAQSFGGLKTFANGARVDGGMQINGDLTSGDSVINLGAGTDLAVNYIRSGGNGFTTIGARVEVQDGDFFGNLAVRRDNMQLKMGFNNFSYQNYPNPGSDVTLTYPNQTCNIVGDSVPQALTNKTNISMTGILTNTNATNSTSSITGSAIYSGGVGIAQDLYVGGQVNGFNRLINQYSCKIVRNTTQTFILNADTAVLGLGITLGAFNNTLANMYDGVNSRINIIVTGKYLINGYVGSLNGGANPNLQVSIRRNADVTPLIAQANRGITNYLIGNCTGLVSLTAGDSIRLFVKTDTIVATFGSITDESLAFTLSATLVSF